MVKLSSPVFMATIVLIGGHGFSLQAAPFTLGNLLVSRFRAPHVLEEYTPDGVLVQSINIERPKDDLSPGDVVFDSQGRAHVVNNKINGTPDYLSTYDPFLNQWTHTPAGFSNWADLTIQGNHIFSSNQRINVNTFQVDTFDIPIFGPAETSIGRDGLLYSVKAGTGSNVIQRSDPTSFASIGGSFGLADPALKRPDTRGIAVTESGDIYVADWAQRRIVHFDSDANYVNELSIGVSPTDLNLRGDGVLAVGGRFGEVVITDTSLSSFTTFDVGDGVVFVGFVAPPQVPEPSSTIAILSLGLFGLTGRRRVRC